MAYRSVHAELTREWILSLLCVCLSYLWCWNALQYLIHKLQFGSLKYVTYRCHQWWYYHLGVSKTFSNDVAQSWIFFLELYMQTSKSWATYIDIAKPWTLRNNLGWSREIKSVIRLNVSQILSLDTWFIITYAKGHRKVLHLDY